MTKEIFKTSKYEMYI